VVLGALSARRKKLARMEVTDKRQACNPVLQTQFANQKDFFDRLHVFHVRQQQQQHARQRATVAALTRPAIDLHTF
jgi:hypothetical protein